MSALVSPLVLPLCPSSDTLPQGLFSITLYLSTRCPLTFLLPPAWPPCLCISFLYQTLIYRTYQQRSVVNHVPCAFEFQSSVFVCDLSLFFFFFFPFTHFGFTWILAWCLFITCTACLAPVDLFLFVCSDCLPGVDPCLLYGPYLFFFINKSLNWSRLPAFVCIAVACVHRPWYIAVNLLTAEDEINNSKSRVVVVVWDFAQ